jgi:hypothetical protein
MTISLQYFSTGQTNYVSSLNANNDTIAAAVASLQTGLSAVSGVGALSIGTAFNALFGDTVSVIGASSYACSGASTTLTVQPGFAFVPSLGQVVRKASSTAISFAGLTAATYYIRLDATGGPIRRLDRISIRHDNPPRCDRVCDGRLDSGASIHCIGR